MTTLEQILFGNGDYNQKKSFIDNMSVNELISIRKPLVKTIIEKAGNQNKELNIRRDFCKGNDWNSQIEGVYISSKGDVFVNVYIQNTKTDTTDVEYFDTFFRRGEYFSRDNYLNAGVDYKESEKAEVMRSILYQCIFTLFSDEQKKIDQIARLSHWSLTNPVEDYFYNKYNLRYEISKYTPENRVANKMAYYHAKTILDDYITENYLDLVNKSNEELDTIYKEVFQKAMNEFVKTFDYKKWRSEQLFLW